MRFTGRSHALAITLAIGGLVGGCDTPPAGSDGGEPAGDAAIIEIDAAMSGTDAGEMRADTGAPQPRGLTRQLAALDQSLVEICECDPGVFESADDPAAACVEFGRTPLEDACRHEVFAAHFDDLVAEADCRAPILERLVACLGVARCHETALDDCTEVALAGVVECPSPDESVRMATSDTMEMCVQRSIVGPAGMCPDSASAVSAVGSDVFTGSTITAGDDLAAPTGCADGEGGGSSPERALRWMAPSAGTFTIDTLGSNFNTLIYVLDGCDRTTTHGCNDNARRGEIRSAMTITLTEGEEVVIVVEGFSNIDAGEFVVNIAEVTP